ncbi:hypothetical protein V8G54_035739 [Vigna mungo]|uniref:Uncharacterized protein n=1 Tax=Vigna mungo TaxID=3915 RepID=A0AAQ3MFM7_VIGMU
MHFDFYERIENPYRNIVLVGFFEKQHSKECKKLWYSLGHDRVLEDCLEVLSDDKGACHLIEVDEPQIELDPEEEDVVVVDVYSEVVVEVEDDGFLAEKGQVEPEDEVEVEEMSDVEADVHVEHTVRQSLRLSLRKMGRETGMLDGVLGQVEVEGEVEDDADVEADEYDVFTDHGDKVEFGIFEATNQTNDDRDGYGNFGIFFNAQKDEIREVSEDDEIEEILNEPLLEDDRENVGVRETKEKGSRGMREWVKCGDAKPQKEERIFNNGWLDS